MKENLQSDSKSTLLIHFDTHTKCLFFPQIFSKYLVFCGIGINNAELYERAQLEIRRNQVKILLVYWMVFDHGAVF